MPLALIIADSADNREMLAAMLTGLGLSSLAAFDGEEGLTMVRALRPDLVISDVSLPRMNGIQLMQTIRKEGQLAGVSWILTGSPEREEDALTAGCEYFLPEPFTSPQLAEILNRALRDET